MKYIAQPQFGSNSVILFDLSVPSTTPITLDFALNPNSALIYQDSSGISPAFYLFVALVDTSSASAGQIAVYDLEKIISTGVLPSPLQMLPVMTIGGSDNPVGMAIQPGSGNLYVATHGDSDQYNACITVFVMKKGTPGKANSWTAPCVPILTFNNDNGISQVAADIAFDLHGNLWLSSFASYSSTTPPYNFLACYLQPPAIPVKSSPASPKTGLVFINGDPLPSTNVLTPGSGSDFVPLSGPEGIAFDPAGNLWVCNNSAESANVDQGAGTLVMISSLWIENQLQAKPPNTSTQIPLTPTAALPITQYFIGSSANLGGLCFDGYNLYINDEGTTEAGHPTVATVWICDVSSGAVANFKASSITTSTEGNGSMSIFNYYASGQPAPLLTIRDTTIDTGAEPDTTAAGVLWESPDIGVDTSATHPGYWPGTGPTYPYASNIVTPIVNTSPLPVVGTTTITPGDSAFVYVKVANYGTAPSTGTEILKVYYALWSAGLNWPAPWDGSEFDSAGNPEGGVIGEVQIPQLPVNSEIYLQVQWKNVPNPTNYINANDVQPSHFCLLARIESSSVYPFGMYKPEEVEIAGTTGYETAIMDNTANNAAIAWRNITISAPGASFAPDFKIIKLSVFGANFGPVAGLFSFGIQTVGAGGKVERIKAKVIVKAEGKALERLLAAKFEEKRFKHLGEGRFEMLDTKRGMSNIHLPAKELLPFTVEFMPEEDVRDFAVRVIQYLHTGGTEEVIGGQTFVIGKVKGFPQRAR